MRILEKLVLTGISDQTNYDKILITRCNALALLTIGWGFFYTFFTICSMPLFMLLFPSMIVISAFMVLLCNAYGFHLTARMLLSIIPLAMIYLYHGYLVPDPSSLIISLYFLECSLAFYVWLLADFRKKNMFYSLVSIAFLFFCLVSQSKAITMCSLYPAYIANRIQNILFSVMSYSSAMSVMGVCFLLCWRQMRLFEKGFLVINDSEYKNIDSICERITKNVKDMIYHMSLPDGSYEYVSPASEAITGYTPQEFYDESMLIKKIIHPDWLERLEKEWQNLLEGNMPDYYEYQIIDKTGHVKWLRQNNTLLVDYRGKPLAIEGVVRDITDQKKIEESLRENEEKLSVLFNKSFELAGILDVDGIVIEVNQTALRFAGVEKKEVLGKYLWDSIWWSHSKTAQKQLKEIIHTAVTKGNDISFESTNIAKDGTIHTVEVFIRPLKDEMGNVHMLIVEGNDITERIKMEGALKQQESRLSLILYSLPIVFYITQISSSYGETWVSEQGEDITGFSSVEFIRHPGLWKERLHPEDRERVLSEFDTLNETNRIQVEYRWEKKDGSYIWLLDLAALVIDKDNKTRKIVGTWLDITSHKVATEEVKKSYNLMQAIIKQTTFGLLIAEKKDDVWTIPFVNNVYATILQTPVQVLQSVIIKKEQLESMEHLIWEYYPDGRLCTMEEHPIISVILKQEGSGIVERIIKRADGSTVRVYIEAVPVFNEEGEMFAVVSILHDISAYKKSEEALVRTRLLLQAAIEQSPAGIIVADSYTNRIILINPAAFTIFGEEISKSLDSSLEEYLKKWQMAQKNGKEVSLLRVIQNGEVLKNIEVMIQKSNNERKVLSLNAAPVRDHDNNIIAEIIVFSDITEWRVLENRLTQAQKMEAIGTLAGGIAHDFNNILGGIIGSIELLEMLLMDEQLHNWEEESSYIDTIKQASQRATDIIRQLLTISRKQELKLQDIDLNVSLQNIKNFCQNSFPKTVDLRFKYVDEPVYISADPT